MAVYSEATQKKIDAVRKRIRSLEDQKEQLLRQVEKLESLESPIRVGARIEWSSGAAKKTGRVISIQSDWNGCYIYRCQVLSKKGQPIGIARVGESHQPSLIS